MRRVLCSAVLAGSVLSVIVSIGLATQSIVVGSAEGNWVYPYIRPFSEQSIALFGLSSALVFALCAVPSRVARRHEWLMVTAWLLVGLVVQWLLRTLTPATFTQIFVSDTANSFFTPTASYSATTLLSDFERLRHALPLHAQSNMPGKLLFVSALRHVSSDPAAMAWLVLVLSNLGGLPLYFMVRDLFRDRRVALFSLALYLFVPAKFLFFPLLNTVTPVVVLTCGWLLVRWLRTGRTAFAALLGASLYVLVLYEPLPLVMGLLFAVLIARALDRDDIGWARLLWQGTVAVAAFGALYVLLVAAFHFDLLATLRRAEADAAAFNAGANRPYAVWVWGNVIEFGLAMGVSQAVIFCGVLGVVVSRGIRTPRRLWEPISVLCLGLAAVLAITDVIGLNRGEVTRLWIFLACFLQIPAAYACARLNSRLALALVLGTTLLQNAIGTAMIGFVMP